MAVGDRCPVCYVGRIQRSDAKTCSPACGSVRGHARRDPVVRERHYAAMRAGRRRIFLENMIERFKAEIEPFRDRVPAPAELAEAFARVYRLGKTNGWQGCRARFRAEVKRATALRKVS